jgi:nitroreductase
MDAAEEQKTATSTAMTDRRVRAAASGGIGADRTGRWRSDDSSNRRQVRSPVVREHPVLALLRTQRACRSYSDVPVPDADMATMLEAATHAPSAENAQPWVFVVVRAEETRNRLAEVARRRWAEGGRRHAEASLRAGLLAEVDEANASGFGGAPVVVVVGGDTTATPRRALPSSVFPAVQNLLVAATALGYGSALTTLASYAPDEVRAAVGLPDTVEPMALVPIGRPSRRLGPPRRAPIAAKAHRDVYGQPFAPERHQRAGSPPLGGRPGPPESCEQSISG